MKKKIIEVESEVTSSEEVLKIGLLGEDFGRGDLNLMRDKLNEVINKLNGN